MFPNFSPLMTNTRQKEPRSDDTTNARSVDLNKVFRSWWIVWSVMKGNAWNRNWIISLDLMEQLLQMALEFRPRSKVYSETYPNDKRWCQEFRSFRVLDVKLIFHVKYVCLKQGWVCNIRNMYLNRRGLQANKIMLIFSSRLHFWKCFILSNTQKWEKSCENAMRCFFRNISSN